MRIDLYNSNSRQANFDSVQARHLGVPTCKSLLQQALGVMVRPGLADYGQMLDILKEEALTLERCCLDVIKEANNYGETQVSYISDLTERKPC